MATQETTPETTQETTQDSALGGYCGLYCGACDIRRLYLEAQAEGRTAEWSEVPAPLKKVTPKPLTIVCHGCKSDTVFAGCARCPLRACARRKQVEFCHACASYPCLRTRLFALVGRLFSLERHLPHLVSKAANVERLRCVGTQAWLREQEQHWHCPECGTPFSWYRGACKKCGKDLTASGYNAPEGHGAD